MILADLHIHSTFSDGKLTIPELVDLYGTRGFGAIAITDHLCADDTIIGKAAVYLGRTLTPATSGSFIFEEVLNSGLPMVASSDRHHPRQDLSCKFYQEDAYDMRRWVDLRGLGSGLNADSLRHYLGASRAESGTAAS